jgi:hypothetical protein
MKQTWIIHQLERQATDGFVFNVHWRLAMSETVEDRNYYADTYGVIAFTQNPESLDYIPYEELTEEIVVGWVKESLGEEKLEEMEEMLSNRIENQINPPTLSGLPWQDVTQNNPPLTDSYSEFPLEITLEDEYNNQTEETSEE